MGHEDVTDWRGEKKLEKLNSHDYKTDFHKWEPFLIDNLIFSHL